jgi:hypothetical protein
MRPLRRVLILGLALTLPLWVAAGASAKPPKCEEDPTLPGCQGGEEPDPTGSVEVTIEQNLPWVHEAGDRIFYTITVTNGSGEDVTVTDSLTGLSEVVVAGGSAGFTPDYTVGAGDIPTVPDVTWDLVNEVTVTDSGGVVATASVTADATYYEVCNPGGAPSFTIGTWACIWKPVTPGTYTIEITPVPPFARPANVAITIRDHIPGNWCGTASAKWNPHKDSSPSLTLKVDVPQAPIELPDPWVGVVPECSGGGFGGDYTPNGQYGSFYLVADGNVTITSG